MDEIGLVISLATYLVNQTLSNHVELFDLK